MYIESSCPGCNRTLRVDADHAGKPARCPTCNTVYTVPDQSAKQSAAEAEDLWSVKIPEGQTFGPISRKTLDQWVAEGRVSDDCRLMSQFGGVWEAASDVYPVLRPVPKVLTVPPAFDNPATGMNPGAAAAPTNESPLSVRFINPHRGVLVLILGILSWAVGCPVFGIMAWVMGSNDLRDMQRGAMDARGAGLTQAGQIIGMIHAIVTLVGIVIAMLVLLFLGMLN